jgi:hypothetical protein
MKVKDAFKKQAETDHLNMFRNKFAGFPTGEIVPGESPDFTVEIQRGRIGIEIVGLYRDELDVGGLLLRARERLQDKLLGQAVQIYESLHRDLPFVEVNVHWSSHVPVAKSRVPEVAAVLAQLVATNLPDTGGQAFLGYPHHTWKRLPAEVDYLFVHRPAGLPEHAWGSSRGAAVPKLTPDDLREVISKKESKLPVYRQGCSEVWLLIVSDGLAPSNHFEPTPEIASARYDTDFDRVFLLHYSHGTVLEVNTSSDTAARGSAPPRDLDQQSS